MTRKTKSAPYNLLARHYDELGMESAQMNRRARWNILGRSRIQTPGSVCDLGCGSGETALDFARTGCTVFAVDLAPVFCRIVRKKAREEGLRVRVIEADMRSFELPEPVELVTCEFAALNHVPRQSDLSRVLRSVWQALKPGGHFLFDINTLKCLQDQMGGTHWFEAPDFKLVMQGEADIGRRKARLTFDWFLPKGRLWQHRRERVDNIHWTDEDIRTALRTAGFGRIKVWDGVDVRPFHAEARRGYDKYYLARKPVLRKRR